jgi:hypothetical protein
MAPPAQWLKRASKQISLFTNGEDKVPNVRRPQQSEAEATEFVRVWALADGTRCVLVVVDRLLELRVMDNDAILRQAQFTAVQSALDVAQIWRIECDGCFWSLCNH